MARDEFIQVARTVPFDNSSNGFTSQDTQSAIEEVNNKVVQSSKAFTFAAYNGNANTGRYLEFFSGISSDLAPIKVIGALTVLAIVARTTSTSSTCDIGFYNIVSTPVLLYTVSFSNQKEVIVSSPSLFVLPASGELAIKIDSGSISKPHLYFTGQGG